MATFPGVDFLELDSELSDEEKRRWYRRADVVVAPATHGESFGLILLEAMASETRVVASDIAGYRDAAGSHAVLFRAGYMSADLEIELTARGIPFEKWGGIKFLEAAHVKDVLSFLRILENPRDEVSWYRLLMLMPGIGESTARGAIDSMAMAAWDSEAFGRYEPPPTLR